MNKNDILTLFQYNTWANFRIMTAAACISHAQYVSPTTHSFGTVRGTLVHLLDAEFAWRELCEHGTTEYFDTLTEEAFPTFDLLARRWELENLAMNEYLARLTDDDLNGTIRYTTPEGAKRERLLWHCLFQVANHATQHRSEAAAILTEFGSSPGDMDFTAFLNESS